MSDPPVARPPSRLAARLTRLSFVRGERAAEMLAGPTLRWWDVEANAPTDDRAAAVIAALGRSADPDAALEALVKLVDSAGGADLRTGLETSASLRSRLIAVLATSVELSAHLLEHPHHWTALLDDFDLPTARRRLATALDGGASASSPTTSGASDAPQRLRAAYRREIVAIAGRDLSAELDLVDVTEALSDLAGDLVQAVLELATRELGPAGSGFRLAIIGMGKAGARELNYISDVDVIFVAEPAAGCAVDDDTVAAALRAAGQMATAVMTICRQIAWEVDPGLRPEGKNGPLVRTLASHETYYHRWASTWEFQALLKARWIAGDEELGLAFQRIVEPMVWSAAERSDFVADVQAMRRRVVEHIPPEVATREIKLGRGGLRDVEFAVQLLQLVHGRGDDALRVAATLPALSALRDGGYVGRADATSLIDAYRFLRAVEHRLQLRRLRRTHVVPADPAQLQWLGRAMGYRPDARGDARAVFEAEWALHAREVRRLHEKLFYRPLLEAVARVPTEDLRLTPEQAWHRLSALGFRDPEAALRHIDALTSGLSRRAALQRTLLPVLLSDFADAPDPDRGLLAYRQVSEQLGSTPWYLRLLRDEGAVASRLALVLGTSQYVARMLGRAPEALQLLADNAELMPRARLDIESEMAESAQRQADSLAAVSAIRAVRRQELLRIAFADLLGTLDVASVCAALSATTEATLQASLHVAQAAVLDERGLAELPLRFAIIAMGRLGGAETSYGSDADVMFVFEPREDADRTQAPAIAQQIATRLRALLGSPSSVDPPLGIDADLRPEGRDGPLARSLESFRQYYARWSAPWEAQALLRARFVAGDSDLGARFIAMIDPVRYPVGGLSTAELTEIRRIKARIDSERLPRGADPTTHTKLGRGGLADVEWTIQLLQLAHGATVAGLRTTRTLEALDAALNGGLITIEQRDLLAAAWQLATHVRNALMLVRDRAEDQLPHQGGALLATGRAMGYPLGFDPGQLVDDYRRATRRARRVVEQIFYA